MRVHESDYYVMRGSGGAMRVHESPYYVMRGSGIGSIFSNIFRKLIPLASKIIPVASRAATKVFNFGKKAAQSRVGQKVIKAAKKTAFDTGVSIAQDTLEGKTLKKAARQRMKEAGTKFVDNVEHQFKGGKWRAVKGKKASNKAKGKKKPVKKKKKKKNVLAKKKTKPKKKKPKKNKKNIKKKPRRPKKKCHTLTKKQKLAVWKKKKTKAVKSRNNAAQMLARFLN